MERKRMECDTCRHEYLPYGIEPCNSCVSNKNWEAKPTAPEAPADGIDDDECGPEIIRQEDITSASQFKDGPMLETARAVVKQITRLDYAIAGVRSKIASIGIKFTDKDLSRDEIAFLVGQLNALQCDLFELEEEREAVEHVKDRDA